MVNMEPLLLLGLSLSLFIFLCVLKYNKRKDHFESKGIPYVGDSIVSLVLNLLTGVSYFQHVKHRYRELRSRNVKVGGVIDFGKVALFVTDPEICKAIMVKDFEHFQDRRAFVAEGNEVIFDKMLGLITGDKWRTLRAKLSPTFTTGKIKNLFSLFEASGDKLVKFVEEEMALHGEIELSTAYSKYTMDIIASAACGMKSGAFETREPSLFERMGKRFTFDFSGIKLLQFVVTMTAPKVAKALGFKILEQEVNDFYMGAIKSQILHRANNNVKGNDFIQLMLEARSGSLKTDENDNNDDFEKEAVMKKSSNSGDLDLEVLDDDGIVANVALFMVAGFEGTQAFLLFAAYLLALNEGAQEKLREEVGKALEESGGRFSYDAVASMTYLDMVLNETLRMYPPASITDRTCTLPYKIPGTDYVMQVGEIVQIPIIGFHHDEEYWKEPEKFDPERFSPENKGDITPYTFQAFGHGPRNCIGMRFAMAESKVALANLVYNFKLRPSKRTVVPIRFFASRMTLKPEAGVYLALEKIIH